MKKFAKKIAKKPAAKKGAKPAKTAKKATKAMPRSAKKPTKSAKKATVAPPRKGVKKAAKKAAKKPFRYDSCRNIVEILADAAEAEVMDAVDLLRFADLREKYGLPENISRAVGLTADRRIRERIKRTLESRGLLNNGRGVWVPPGHPTAPVKIYEEFLKDGWAARYIWRPGAPRPELQYQDWDGNWHDATAWE